MKIQGTNDWNFGLSFGEWANPPKMSSRARTHSQTGRKTDRPYPIDNDMSENKTTNGQYESTSQQSSD